MESVPADGVDCHVVSLRDAHMYKKQVHYYMYIIRQCKRQPVWLSLVMMVKEFTSPIPGSRLIFSAALS